MEVILLTLYNNPNKKREIIMEHYINPQNKKDLYNEKTIDVFSEQCVDELKLHITFENNKVKEAFWDGIGCAVFKSSVDIFLNLIKNKDKNEVKEIVQNFDDLIHGKKENIESLKELNIFNNVHKQLNRLSCAKMIIRAIKKAI